MIVWADARARAAGPGLRHLDLAAEIGRRHPAGRLLVRVSEVMPSARAVAFCRPVACEVVLSQAAGRDAWAHELGHLLDPLDARRAPWQREAWADAVSLVLLWRPAAGVDEVLGLMADRDPGVWLAG